jgi:hypothetical protein
MTRDVGGRMDTIKVAIGGLIALAVIGYVASQWKKFD